MPTVYKSFFEDNKELSVNACENDTVVGVANAECDGDVMTLTFIGVRETHRKRGIATDMLALLVAESRRRATKRIIGKNVRSAASLRLLERMLGAAVIHGCGKTEKLSEQPTRFIFAPSMDTLIVESEYELTAEWAL